MQLPYLADARDATLAIELIDDLGVMAGREAAARADRSRDLGNMWRYCRWRQIERLIAVLENDVAPGRMH